MGSWFVRRMLLAGLSLGVALAASAGTDLPVDLAAKIDPELWRQVDAGEVSELIVLLDGAAIETEADAERRRRGLRVQDAQIVARKRDLYRQVKADVQAAVGPDAPQVLSDYDNLPMEHVRVRDSSSLAQYLRRSEVVAVYANERRYAFLSEGLALIGWPAVQNIVGRRGEGTYVAVLDTGVNYLNAAFGCTAVATPASCKVVYAADIAAGDGSLDDTGHGTNVAGVVAGAAPDAKLIALDVFTGGGAYDSDIVSGINLVIALTSSPYNYNVVAINLSLGGLTKYTSTCSTGNVYKTPIANAKAAGILTVVAAGNSGWTNGIASPACSPGAVSVGAVYDANVGARAWVTDPSTTPQTACTDSTTAADKVTCFSNDASFMTLFAPGSLTTAAGATYSGTSQAAPYVAGAVAALQSAYATETPDQTLLRISSHGTTVTDTRSGINLSHPRLNLAASFDAGPANDLFAAALSLAGNGGQTTASNVGATKEVGEPNHAGAAGGTSVWWQWTAPAAGSLSVDTHGSGIDTLLALYTGSAVGALASVAANDDDGYGAGTSGLSAMVTAGTTYRIAVDGKAAAGGAITLNWQLRQAQAISFTPIADQPAESNLTLAASASSGLPVSYASLTPAVCTLTGNVAALVAGGTCSISADQAGDADYLSAPTVTQSFAVTKLMQTISFPPLGDVSLDHGPLTVTVAASSGLPVELASLTASTCSVAGDQVSLLAVGTCSLQASQPGDAVYAAATPVSRSFAVLAVPPSDADVPLPVWSLLALGAGLLAPLLGRARHPQR